MTNTEEGGLLIGRRPAEAMVEQWFTCVLIPPVPVHSQPVVDSLRLFPLSPQS